MIELTQSLERFLLTKYRKIYVYLKLGHIEMFNDKIQQEYLEWCRTDEGKQYLKGGSKYKDPERKMTND